MKQMMDLMKNLSINLMNNTGGRGRGRGSYEAVGEGRSKWRKRLWILWQKTTHMLQVWGVGTL